ncbi:MAG: hypothetical protein ABGX16_25960 [Pirellulales bacterium]
MRSLLLIVASFIVTVFAWGIYGPVLHWGQEGMKAEGVMELARWRPFVCVGMAYFAIGVIVPALILFWKGEQGKWTAKGITLSLGAGALGALGALGIILAFNFGGKPVFVMPLVFGGAPVVNSFLTIYMAKRMREIGPLFLAGLVMVILGAVTVMLCAPKKPHATTATTHSMPHLTHASLQASQDETTGQNGSQLSSVMASPAMDSRALPLPVASPDNKLVRWILQLTSIACVIICWGAYGPTLHKGQAAMQQSRLRPLICVGLAYFAIAVLVPNLLLQVNSEASNYHFRGTLWSLAAGSAGAIGALGIIMAFNFGGKPIYVMPLVFGGAPVVNTLFSTVMEGLWGEIGALFLAGLILVIAGAAMTLVFAPKGSPPAPRSQAANTPPIESAGAAPATESSSTSEAPAATDKST